MAQEDGSVCRDPTDFFLLGVALRSFFMVLATHLLAGEVDTTLRGAGVPFLRRIWWWCRYFNPLNLSWRYYSMFAYRFTARSWDTPQLALINHEAHPLLPPLPYILGETVLPPPHVRRLEMAGLLSSQGILTLSAAYQGALAIQYAISTEGIPYLPNTTVPLAMVGLFRVMASKWVATKLHVDAYPYPCVPTAPPAPTSSSSSRCWRWRWNADSTSSRSFLHRCKSGICGGWLWASLPAVATDSSSTSLSVAKRKGRTSVPITKSHVDPSPICKPQERPTRILSLHTDSAPPPLPAPDNASSTLPLEHEGMTSAPVAKSQVVPSPICKSQECPRHIVRLCTDSASPSSCPSTSRSNTESFSSSAVSAPMHSIMLPHMSNVQLPSVVELSLLCDSHPLSVVRSPNSSVLPVILSPYSALPSLSHAVTPIPSVLTPIASADACINLPSLSSSSSSAGRSKFRSFTICQQAPVSSFSSPEVPVQGHQMHTQPSSLLIEPPFDYKSNKIVVMGWIGVLVGLVTMSFLPYKVTAAYQLPQRWLQFSMQMFYQYIAVSELVFHAYLLYQGPRALANRVLFFDHWAFKAQTAGFFILLVFMLVIALLDFLKHDFYRTCA